MFLRLWVMGKFYAVRRGRKTGVFNTWQECEQQVKKFRGARFKKFDNQEEAEQFVASTSCTTSGNVGALATKRPHSHEGTSTLTSKRFRGNDWNSAEDSDRPVVFSDGCCTKNGRRGARAGIGVFWGPDDYNNISERLEGEQTNQRAELMAAVRALESAIAREFQSVEVRTDSRYTIMGVTDWIKRWKRNGFKSINGQLVKNQEEFKRLDELCQEIDVKWTHVPGHRGIPGNEAADSLAKKGAKEHDQ